MFRKMILPLCVLALCAAGLSSPVSVRTHAGTAAGPNDPTKDLHNATVHASMSGSLRGKLLPLLNSAKQNFKSGNPEAAAADLLAFIALLEEQSGNGIAPEVANELIGAANAIVASVQYPFASDYDRVPIVVIGPQNKPAVDWRTKGVVTGVKTQGQCESDYAFSATGVMEAAWGISKGQLVSLSEQQLIDCDAANNGCSGGSTVRSLEYVIAHHGITTEQAYPYTAVESTCKTSTAVVTIASLSRPTPGDESALEEFVAGKAPVSAVLRIDSSAWDNYSGGIFDPAAGTPIPPRYVAVLIVGYDLLGATPYWIVKASYGTSWGNQGYAFVQRGQNALGIANFIVCPTV